MIKLLYILFRRSFLKLAFSDQDKPKGLSKYSFQFIDSEGRKYYAPNDMQDIHLERKAQLIKSVGELNACLTGEELRITKEAIKKALNNGNSPDYAMIGFVVKEWELRQSTLIHTDIVLDITALFYIREDEDPSVFDLEIHNKKVEQFKKDYHTHLSVFFCNPDLNKLLGFSNISDDELMQVLTEGELKVKALQHLMKAYISEEELQKMEIDGKNILSKSAKEVLQSEMNSKQ